MDSSPELSEMAEYMDYYEQKREGEDVTDKKQLKPHAQAHLLSETENCKICGERAARHVHYGATTCFSCRAFFRRSLQNKTAAKYVCRRRSMCEINSKTRKNCQYCRYMKCLAVGMNPNYVLSEDERQKRFRKKKNSGNGSEAPQLEETNDNENQNFGSVTDREETNFLLQPAAPKIEDVVMDRDKSEIAEQLLQLRQNFNPAAVPVIASPPPVVSSSVSSNQTRHSIIVKNETVSPVPDNRQSQPPSFPSNQIKTEDKAVVEEIRSVLGDDLDQGMIYNAFDDIETAAFEESSEDTDLEEIKGRLLTQSDDDSCVSDEDRAAIAKIIADYDNAYFSVNFGEVLIKEMIMCSMFGMKVSPKVALEGYKLQVERLTKIANSLQHFTNLVKSDRDALLKENADLIVSLNGALFFDKKKKGVDQVMSSMGHKDRETMKGMMSDLVEQNKMNHIEYNGFNTVQDQADNHTEGHYQQLQAKVADRINSHCIAVLITFIILFSSDFVKLENKKIVERTQMYYLKLLERHINDVEGKDYHPKLAGILNAVTCLREMADIKKARAINSVTCTQYNNNAI